MGGCPHGGPVVLPVGRAPPRRRGPAPPLPELAADDHAVENHVRNILEKLRLNRRDELIRWAAKRGLDE